MIKGLSEVRRLHRLGRIRLGEKAKNAAGVEYPKKLDHYNFADCPELSKLYGEKGEIAFGNQIRSYVLYPYQLVRDERTELQSPHTDRVLDGDIQEFIDAALRLKAEKGG